MTSDYRGSEILEKISEAVRYFVVLSLMISFAYFIGILRDKVNQLDSRISKIEHAKEQQP